MSRSCLSKACCLWLHGEYFGLACPFQTPFTCFHHIQAFTISCCVNTWMYDRSPKPCLHSLGLKFSKMYCTRYDQLSLLPTLSICYLSRDISLFAYSLITLLSSILQIVKCIFLLTFLNLFSQRDSRCKNTPTQSMTSEFLMVDLFAWLIIQFFIFFYHFIYNLILSIV